MKRVLLILLVLGACRDVPSGAPGSQPGGAVGPGWRARPSREDDRWWLAACGEVMPLRVGNAHSVTPPQLVERVEPQWPEQKTSGIVIIETVVATNGTVCDARILRGLGSDLDSAALAAVKQWRFRPALLQGVPRAAVYTISVVKRGVDL